MKIKLSVERVSVSMTHLGCTADELRQPNYQKMLKDGFSIQLGNKNYKGAKTELSRTGLVRLITENGRIRSVAKDVRVNLFKQTNGSIPMTERM